MRDRGPQRPWTVMIYMAGDNGRVFETAAGGVTLMAEMTSAGYRDIWEMAQVGTTEACAVTCLFDTQGPAYLVEVRRGRGMADSAVRVLREVNTGDPQTLTDFIAASMAAYPAERYALILWNHGTGWRDDDPYAQVRGRGPIRGALFSRPTNGATRPIAFDDSSRDFLDAHELHQALAMALGITGRRLDVIGMDACLMAMIEGARELAPFTDVFVASQEVEPMPGWPYAAVLRRINEKPRITGEQLAIAIVEEFTAAYGGRTRSDTVTQSAIATQRCATTEALCRDLVRTVLANRSPGLQAAFRRARARTLAFQDHDYLDLGDFAGRVAAEAGAWGSAPAVTKAARALRDHLQGRGPQHPVLCAGHSERYADATGLSVYLPANLPASMRDTRMKPYRRLTFAQDAGWDFLVEWMLR